MSLSIPSLHLNLCLLLLSMLISAPTFLTFTFISMTSTSQSTNINLLNFLLLVTDSVWLALTPPQLRLPKCTTTLSSI